jgi:hypothetical protein
VISEADAWQVIALAEQGANVSEIARQAGHDRKTIQTYLFGHRAPGQHRTQAADTYAPFAAYILQRADDDVHLRSSGLHREIATLGYAGSYQAFTRELRDLGVSPACTRHCRPPQLARVTASRQPSAPLPARVAPITGETISSYLSRVAAAAHLPLTTITAVLPHWFAVRTAACDDIGTARPGRFKPGYVSRLATLTGITETALSRALPALARHRDDGRPPLGAAFACHRCAAGHRQTGLVPVHIPACSGSASATGSGSAAPPRSTSPLSRPSPPQAAARHGSLASTAPPRWCSPKPPLARTPSAGRLPSSAQQHSPWPAPAWIPAIPTLPRQRPTPRQSQQRPRFFGRRVH